jgi:hypothetical protein
LLASKTAELLQKLITRVLPWSYLASTWPSRVWQGARDPLS